MNFQHHIRKMWNNEYQVYYLSNTQKRFVTSRVSINSPGESQLCGGDGRRVKDDVYKI